jgi:hypothetical protein
MFLYFEKHFLQLLGLRVWRVEMNIFHCGLRLAGQPDLRCKDSSGHVVIFDWKRCKSINLEGFQDQYMLYPLCDLSQSNFWVYCLQLNLYRHILETEYALTVSGMYIVALHPNQYPRGTHVDEVPRMEKHVMSLIGFVAPIHKISTWSIPGPKASFLLQGTRFP